MSNIIYTQLFTFIIILNYDRIWAANDPDHQLPPPGPNRFRGYPNSHTFFLNGHLVGMMSGEKFVEFPERMARARAETRPVVLRPRARNFLPDGASVFRPHKGCIGFLFDKRINGPAENGEVRVIAPQNYDFVVLSGRTLATYNDGWKEEKMPWE